MEDCKEVHQPFCPLVQNEERLGASWPSVREGSDVLQGKPLYILLTILALNMLVAIVFKLPLHLKWTKVHIAMVIFACSSQSGLPLDFLVYSS